MNQDVFAWYNLIFYIPLGIGVLLVLGVALGGADMHHGDMDGDGDGPDDHSVLSMLGFGRVPLIIVFMTMALTFGGTGVFCNMLLAPLLGLTGLFGLVSLGIASITMVLLTGFIGALVTRWLPTTTTTSFTKYDLVGASGVLLLDADDTSGVAQVVRSGDVYQVDCRARPALPKGTRVLLLEFDEPTNVFTVERDPSTN